MEWCQSHQAFSKSSHQMAFTNTKISFQCRKKWASGQLLASAFQAYSSSTHQSILCASGVPIYDYSVSVTVMDASWQQSDQAFDKLKQKALELGFTAIGVTDPDVSEHVPFSKLGLMLAFKGLWTGLNRI